MTLTTGSQLDRVARCPASAALPQIIDANDEDRDDRDRGKAAHKYLERVPELGREAALAEVDEEWRDYCADIELAKLAKQLSLSHEVAVAYDWQADTARRLQPVAPRAYEVDPDREIALTLDVVGASETTVYVGDYKSGHGWLPAPEDSYQLVGGALAISRVVGATDASVEYLRLRDDGTVRPMRAWLDVFSLEGAADRIRGLMSGLPALRARVVGGEVPDVTEGPWCRYCPARQHCPAKTALVRRVVGNPQAIPYTQPLTPEGALRAYQMLKTAKDAISQVETALYAYAKLTPIPLGADEDGSLRFFGELTRPGNEKLAGPVVHQVLTELYGGESANGAVEMTTTKAAITDVARKHLQAGDKITHATERVLKLVRERNGSTRPTTRSTTEYTVAPDGDTKARKRKAGA